MFSVYKEPQIVKKFLSEKSCRYLIDKAKTNMKPSTVDDRRLDVSFRNCFSYELTDIDSNEILKEIIQGLLKHVNKNIMSMEVPSINKYLPGGFYKAHFDSANSPSNRRRIYTVLIGLNDDYTGGETYFPKLNKEYKLQMGDALIFHNFDTEYNTTELSLHGGKIVDSGEKWNCNIWIHEHHIRSN
jgi:predicted 2-oxoglutarate/Fe(II)-dependent dioxygenase YbiX